MPPEGTNLVLSSDIPNGEGDVLVLDSLDVEACGTERTQSVRWFLLGRGVQGAPKKVMGR